MLFVLFQSLQWDANANASVFTCAKDLFNLKNIYFRTIVHTHLLRWMQEATQSQWKDGDNDWYILIQLAGTGHSWGYVEPCVKEGQKEERSSIYTYRANCILCILSRDDPPASIMSSSPVLSSTCPHFLSPPPPAYLRLSPPIISHLSGSLGLCIFKCIFAYSNLTVKDCFHQRVTINGIFKQPTGFSISHLERHGYARFITAQPPVRRRRDREQGGERGERKARRAAKDGFTNG